MATTAASSAAVPLTEAEQEEEEEREGEERRVVAERGGVPRLRARARVGRLATGLGLGPPARPARSTTCGRTTRLLATSRTSASSELRAELGCPGGGRDWLTRFLHAKCRSVRCGAVRCWARMGPRGFQTRLCVCPFSFPSRLDEMFMFIGWLIG